MSHPFKSEPMKHQLDALRRARKKRSFALFWEMGTGKTFTVINLAAARFEKKQIDSLIVICPTPIKLVWEEEVEKWCPYEYEIFVLESTNKEAFLYFTALETEKIKIVIIGVEALSQGSAASLGEVYAKQHKCMVVADESSRLKNAQAGRTKKACKISSHGDFRMIMTGTPITQGIQDMFGQFQFLNPGIIGLRSYTIFKRRYCVMGGYQDRSIIDYMNTDELMRKVAPYVDIVKKEDVLDLPPKIYEKVIVTPSKNQLALIQQLKDQYYAEHEGEVLTTESVLTRLTRFQQIIGGSFPYDEDDGTYNVKPIEGPNPKLNALSELLEDLPEETKVIIWARFVPEIELIKDLISTKFGATMPVTFYGKDSLEQRKMNKQRFQDGDARFIISSPQVGGMGQTWTSATLVIYYSNDFSYENRTQSEDRAHRKGQEHPVTYVDLEANHPYDKMILKAIKVKGGMAKFVDEAITHEQAIL